MILITRPFEDAKAMSKALKKLGINSFVEPLLRISYNDPDMEKYDDVEFQSFIATSKHAKVFVNADEPLASLPEQGEDAEQLLQWIEANLDPEAGKLIYLRGEKTSVDVAGILKGKGFDVDELIIYRTDRPKEFTERLIRNWDKLTHATFFSSQTLANFLSLRSKHNLALSKIEAVCLSKKIADKASGAGFKQIHISERPNAKSLIDKINEIKQ